MDSQWHLSHLDPEGFLEGPLSLISDEVQQALKANLITKDTVIDDSGCSTPTFNHVRWFTSLKPLSRPIEFTSANGTNGQAELQGTVRFRAHRPSGRFTTMVIGNVLYCPESPVNMLSSGTLRSQGLIRDGYQDALVHKATGTQLAKYTLKRESAVLGPELSKRGILFSDGITERQHDGWWFL